jgi:hypothetical protein
MSSAPLARAQHGQQRTEGQQNHHGAIDVGRQLQTGDKRRDAAGQDAMRRHIVKRQHGDRSAARQGADDKPANDRRGNASRDADKRGHQREVEAAQRPRSDDDGRHLHECQPP